jgi:hypothetical protein
VDIIAARQGVSLLHAKLRGSGGST